MTDERIKRENEETRFDNTVEDVRELDTAVLDVIYRLYSNTIKDLVTR